MKRAQRSMFITVFILMSLMLVSAALAKDKMMRSGAMAVETILTPEEMKWGPAPESLPPGAELAVLEGDPLKSGPFTMRLKVPANYRIPPHWHASAEHVTVVAGTFNVAKGEKEDASVKGKELPAGSFFMMTPRSSHYAWASEETVIQLHGRGPWMINYVNPADDPRKQAK
ncbi:MAG: cupin domain-containing protein [Deltaproteobacteria bacterium]|nr:cupin domain-containing protein [Deltaproteobacteria bacterium]